MSAVDPTLLRIAHRALATNQRALDRLPNLLPVLLPGGIFEGPEYQVCNPTRTDRHPGSFKINLQTCSWAEFARGHEAKGSDVISLTQYVKGFETRSEAVSLLDDLLANRSIKEAQRNYRPRPRGEPVVPIPFSLNDVVNDNDFRAFVGGLVPGFEPTDVYPYHDAQGFLVSVVTRFRSLTTKDAKTFRPAVFVEWSNKTRGWSSQRLQMQLPLFCLPELLQRRDAPVLVVEGEKTRDAAVERFTEYVTTTSANGCNAARQSDWSPLAGRDVTIWPDKDEGGADYAVDVEQLARAAGARSVRVISLPPVLPDGWDLADDPPPGFDPRSLIESVALPAAQAVGEVPSSGVQALAAATPFVLGDPTKIAPREVIYAPYIRGFLSALVAPPKAGKTALAVAESLAMITGRNLLGTMPFEPMKVWIISEDPRDEVYRRIAAAAIHYHMRSNDLAGRLFVDSFREKKLIVADKSAHGIVINYPLMEALVAEIRQRGIDHLFVDPFVSTHRVPENDNGAIADAAQAWNEVADKANCSLCLIHHTRKMNGSEVTVDDMRGGSSLLGVVRSVRTLNQMTEAEVKKVEVDAEQRPRYIKIGSGASNMFAPSDRSSWFFLESVDIGNRTSRRPSDQVGVAAPWSWPAQVIPEVTMEQLLAIQKAIAEGRCKESVQANDWAGNAVADVLKLDANDPGAKAAIKSMLKRWEEEKYLKKDTEFDRKKTRDVPVYRIDRSVIID